jgi:hypothetical protein
MSRATGTTGVTVSAVALGGAIAAGGLAFAAAAGDVVGTRLPSVKGHSLAGDLVRFPEDLAGAPAVLLVAYRRGTQADVDRWTELLRREVPQVRFFEVPTIPNPLWRPLAGWIDGGMRRGVPREMWPSVVTLYREGGTLKRFLGDAGGLKTHVVVLDGSGTVAWFCADGYSDRAAAQLVAALQKLSPPPVEVAVP